MELDDATRVRLIKKAFSDCEQEPSNDEVARQFYYETGRKLGGKYLKKARRRRGRPRTCGASARHH